MNLKTDKKKDPLKGVYIFYSVFIALCILALFVFNLNIYAKAVLCTLAFLCVCIMRSLKNAMTLPPDIDPDTMQPIEEAEYVEAETVEEPMEETDSTIKAGSAIDDYLALSLSLHYSGSILLPLQEGIQLYEAFLLAYDYDLQRTQAVHHRGAQLAYLHELVLLHD